MAPFFKEMLDSPICNSMTKCCDGCSDCQSGAEWNMMRMKHKMKRKLGQKSITTIKDKDAKLPDNKNNFMDKITALKQKLPTKQTMT